MSEIHDPYNHLPVEKFESVSEFLKGRVKNTGEYGEEHPRQSEYAQALVHDRKLIRKTLSILAILKDEYVVIGGASLVLRGIKQETEDIDLLVSQDGFDVLSRQKNASIDQPPAHAVANGATNTTVHFSPRSLTPISAFTYLNGNGYYPMTFESILATSEVVDGFQLSSVAEVVASKQALGRYKDILDLNDIAKKFGLPLHIPELPIEDDVKYI